MDNAWANIVGLLVSDGHLREARQGSEDGPTDPRALLVRRRRDKLDLHGCWGKADDLLLNSLGQTFEHDRAAREDDVGVEIVPDVDIALHDRGEQDFARYHRNR